MSETATDSASAERLVLEGVPKVSFDLHAKPDNLGVDRCPECVPWPSCVRSLLEFESNQLGCERRSKRGSEICVHCAYAFLSGISGAAFRLNWKDGWHGDNSAAWLADGDDAAAMFRQTLETLNREYEILCGTELKKEGRWTREFALEKIRSSLQAGRPAIAHGVIGPPEPCLITGYDEGGQVLIGWNFFQNGPDCPDSVEYEPSGEYRVRDWFENLWDLIIIGERAAPIDQGQAYRRGLRYALKVARTPKTYGRHNGLAAWDAWIGHLLKDEGFQTVDPEELKLRMEAHDSAVIVVAEGRWYASLFLTGAISQLPMVASRLLEAASCYAREHELMWKVWEAVGGPGQDIGKCRKLAEPATRRAIVEILRQARENDHRAAGLLQEALDGLE